MHAAQAVIVERTGRVIKRHRGVHNELRRLIKDEPRFDLELSAFLGRAYNLKAIADYETGADASVSAELARATIETARRYVGVVAELLA